MKKNIYIFCFLLAVAAACNRNKETSGANPVEILAGDDQKQWKATSETDREGDKDRLTRDEKKETITFYKNGNVTMGGSNQNLSGTWSHAGNELTLHFAGENVTESFTILELDNERMHLRAADGSEMKLKSN